MALTLYTGGEVTDDILKLKKESLTWTKVGRMHEKRGWHQGSIIDLTEELLSHCSQKGLSMKL